MTIQELIEKLKREKEKNMAKRGEEHGADAVLEHWYKKMEYCGKFQELYDCDNYINGMLHGLMGAYFITEQEFEQLIKEMEDYYNICHEKLR